MAFTAPKTWAFQESVESSELNTYLRDNFLAMGPHLIVRKTSDQTVTSSTAFVSDSALLFPVAVSEIVQFEFFVRYDAGTTGDIKVSFSLPSGTIDAVALAPSGASAAYQDSQWISLAVTDGNPLAFTGSGAGSGRILPIHGVYIGGGTGGNVTLRWAQNTSDATATRVLTNSTLWAVKQA